MTDEFLTEGLQGDRYLKALRLADQFESEIEAELRQVGQQMVAENSELFETGIEGRANTGHNPNAVLAFTRVDYPMDRVRGPESDTSLTMNVHLYWCEPEQYNRTDIDGAVRAFGYKIKNAANEDNKNVRTQTRDWPLKTAKDPFTSTLVFYRHVSSTTDIEETGETLVDHFSTFGNEYGVPPDR